MTKNFHAYLFDAIRSKLPEHISMSKEIQQTLHLSRPCAYKKVSGKSPLSLDEALQLAHHHDVSIDHHLFPSRLIPFKKTPV